MRPRHVVFSVMASLDGRSAAPGEGFETIDWFRADDEWLEYSVELLDSADVLVFGWTTFAGMQQYWPSATGPVAERINALPKIVFSRSARETTWANATAGSDPVADVTALAGRVVVLGSADLASTLTAYGLIDEYRIAINPVALGAGRAIFSDGTPRLELELADTRTFATGIVELRYRPRTGRPA